MNTHRAARTMLTALTGAVLALTLIGSPIANAAPAKPVKISLSFIGIYHNGVPVQVKNFTFSKLPVVCNEASGTYDNLANPLPVMDIRNLKFKGKFTSNGVTTKVTGKYKKSLKKVTGTLRVRGDIGQYTGCKSPKIKWKTN